jgi:hypothetical protein
MLILADTRALGFSLLLCSRESSFSATRSGAAIYYERVFLPEGRGPGTVPWSHSDQLA